MRDKINELYDILGLIIMRTALLALEIIGVYYLISHLL
jgi:hypothetical protein